MFLRIFKNFVAVDEAGRGALAGPLVVTGVYIDEKLLKLLIKRGLKFKDSKDLKEDERKKTYELIRNLGIPSRSIFVSPRVIDKIGIQKSFIMAVKKIKKFFSPEIIVLDGIKVNLKESINITRGGRILNSLGAASIIAKVDRDSYMKKLSKSINHFRWEENKGYGTREHFKLINKYGLSVYHRKSFLKKLLGKERN